jgi:hemoglobin
MTTTIRNALILGSLLGASVLFGVDRDALAEEAPTLYTRLGQWDGIQQIVRDTIANHQKNPAIAHYFEDVDADQLAAHVTAFFAAGTGGPNQYQGRDMTSAHASMGLSEDDFDKAVADVLLALDKNDIGNTEKSEVATILESLRPAVMGTGG